MASPFPGMDPYLENTDFWEGFHNGFMHYVQEELQPRLPAPYVATLEMRIYFQPEGETRVTPTRRMQGTVLDLDPVEIREAFVSLREIPSGRLVSSLEML